MSYENDSLQVTLATIPDTANIAPVTVVALPPSDADPVWDEMRVIVGPRMISRAFDPGEPIITGAPIPYVTSSGAVLVMSSGSVLVTGVQP